MIDPQTRGRGSEREDGSRRKGIPSGNVVGEDARSRRRRRPRDARTTDGRPTTAASKYSRRRPVEHRRDATRRRERTISNRGARGGGGRGERTSRCMTPPVDAGAGRGGRSVARLSIVAMVAVGDSRGAEADPRSTAGRGRCWHRNKYYLNKPLCHYLDRTAGKTMDLA